MIIQGQEGMSHPCYEFIQNAWKKELCVNCQRPKGEHSIIEDTQPKSSPVPAKRSSLLMRTSFNATLENVFDGSSKLRRDSSADDWPISDADWCVIDDQKPELRHRSVDRETEDVSTKKTDVKQEVTSDDKMVLNKSKVSFLQDEPIVIGDDGGWDNLTSEPEDTLDDSDSSEDISFTEEEKEFLLLALENTLWNGDNRNLLNKTVDTVRRNSSKEFEDVQLLTLWKVDRFATLRDCDKLIPRRYGTFPLRNKSSKKKLEHMFEEKSKHLSNIQLQRISEHDGELGGHKSSSETNLSKVKPELPKKSKHVLEIEASPDKRVPYDESEEKDVKDEDEVFSTEGEDLFETFNPDIDLESSTAGMDLVDLLNNVLAKYSDSESFKGIEGHELLPEATKEELQQVVEIGEEGAEKLESKFPKGSIKSKAFEAKLASLAATLDLSKKKGKKPAPRPPSCPPPEPSAKKSVPNLSDQPNFKMVPVGKPIFDQGQGEKPLSPKRTSDFQTEIVETSKSKTERSNKKGITSFFRNMLRRGRDSVDSSSEQESGVDSTTKSQSSITNSDGSSTESLGSKTEGPPSPSATENVGSSPVMKMKVLPTIAKPPRTSVIISTSDGGQKKVKQSPEMPRASKGSPKVSKKDPSKSLEKVKEENQKKKPVERKGSDKVTEKKENILDRKDSDPGIDKKGQDKGGNSKESEKGIERKGSDKETPSLPTKPRPLTTRPKPVNVPEKPAKPPPTAPQSHGQTKPPVSPQPITSTVTKQQMSSSTESHESVKERSASISSHEGPEERGSESPNSDRKPTKYRRRAKSPKRSAAPIRPQAPAKAPENRNSIFTKELEMKICRGLGDQKPGKEARPRPPIDTRMSSSTSQPSVSPSSPDVSFIPSAMSASVTEVRCDNLDQPVSPTQDVPPAEKIELPRAQSRKSFLGKLGNRKSRAPPRPPSIVKRAKSITENSLTSDGPMKKLEACDISGPVLISDMTSSQIVNRSRRNTITIGDDCSFVSGGSTSSGSTNDKYDEWPQFSPLGSMDNLYEPIVPKEPPPPPPNGNVYDPVSSKASQPALSFVASCQLPTEGYLEPVRSSDLQRDATLQQSRDTTLDYPDHVDISEERRILLASQPIYEEINGYTKDFPVKQPPVSDTKCKLTVNVKSSSSFNEKDVQATPVSPSASHNAFSSESESSSASSTLNRPKPIPRKRPGRKTESTGSEQPYVAMNRPSIAVALNEVEVRDMLNQLTSQISQTLSEIYTQYERVFTKETVNLNITGAGPIKWVDFDIYGKPIHTSERCVVYNAKLKLTSTTCQLMLLHTKPDLTNVQHSSLLKPTVIFTDNIPFSYLTEDFIKTSQLLQNLQNPVNQSNHAKCFVAIGLFDVNGDLNHKLAALKDGFSADPGNCSTELETLLFYMLQLLSAISHCLDQGFTLGEANFRDVFIVTNSNHCHGDIIAFLPHQRLHDSSNVDSVCELLERYFTDTLVNVSDEDYEKHFSCIATIERMLQTRRLDSLALVRSYVEYLLWGPKGDKWQSGAERLSNLEPQLSMWLERERAALIHKFASIPIGSVRDCSVLDFYRMKFLLKASAVGMSECMRHHVSY
ncbi:uncharacterized protein LOC110465950 [Mizuhopecten yessoensis]|uniref:Uncharacterized protein n=1 Tax=Mizuhopecten yessoensis TaxID=6573 RepID=A0A210PQG3_MIZYE|nr:uncharacterized protein LOC110465950 [Mizuhopecten yessoensis]XP_021377839.1 uncharacterized protein LOC110465950 [Mizuhopecten yessoensis]XP_021377840.1 uncharacterized protein LOC110465950 [Mizuhopecten yessoensis]XP_021377841.1 uncharacterized protein LOC110465950 [Mizuhopecten yessoensis]OWF38723.1 hypothetical protein KP79_PYT23165 [Mizuhopecten yessoensis]